jgi:hypothetical protein
MGTHIAALLQVISIDSFRRTVDTKEHVRRKAKQTMSQEPAPPYNNRDGHYNNSPKRVPVWFQPDHIPRQKPPASV